MFDIFDVSFDIGEIVHTVCSKCGRGIGFGQKPVQISSGFLCKDCAEEWREQQEQHLYETEVEMTHMKM